MLSKWTLANFKSFKEPTEIKLAPITVLAGANSSGKSTIIQSILLLKQTIEYIPVSRAIGLNGPLLKLGRFDDIKNIGNQEPLVQLSWTLDNLSSYRPTGTNLGAPFLYGYPTHLTLKQAEFAVSFGINSDTVEGNELSVSRSSSELRQLHPVLQSVSCEVDYTTVDEGTEIAHKATSKLRRMSTKRDVQALENSNTAYAQAKRSLTFHVESLDQNSRRDMIQQRQEGRIIGASARHFFPFQFGVVYNKSKDIARRVANAVASYQHYNYYYDTEIRKVTVPAEWSKRLIEIVESAVSNPESNPAVPSLARAQERLSSFVIKDMPLSELLDSFQALNRKFDPRARSVIRNAIAENQDNLEAAFLELTALPEEVGFEIAVPRVMHYGVEQAIIFFQHSIRYLGPLRDEPRPIYPLEASVNPTDVGYRGEHTAAVLDLHSDRPVRYIRSADAENLIGAEERTATLQHAVADWLSYLGVAESVRTADLGKIGHQLQVRTGDVSKEHDLTNVGVGVSQLLPIIVMALLAPSPSLLIFEQPELHLHPKVQARLADFFISLGLIGKQCLLETHSEYLVERLRRRIAEADGNTLNEKIGIFFTQKVEGRTVCTPVEVTAYGAITNWPSDFFDQTQFETQHLLKAAQRKLKREREKSAK